MAEQLDVAIQRINANTKLLKALSAEQLEGFVLGMMITLITCTKHEGFSEEEEWRAVYVPDLFGPSPLESEVLAIDGLPQTVFNIPFDRSVSKHLEAIDLASCLETVLIGPSVYPWVQFEAFQSELNKIGCAAKVITSPLPIRG